MDKDIKLKVTGIKLGNLRKSVEKVAKKNDRSLSWTIRQIISEWLNAKKES